MTKMRVHELAKELGMENKSSSICCIRKMWSVKSYEFDRGQYSR